MLISPNERLAIYIDGPDFLATCRRLRLEIDFKRVLDLFRAKGSLVRANFYATTRSGEPDPIRPLLDWLSYNGYTTVARPQKQSQPTAAQLDLAVDAMRLSGYIDHLVLFSGAEDLTGLTLALKEAGKRVTVVATFTTDVAVADELRRAADQFIDISEIADQIQRVSR